MICSPVPGQDPTLIYWKGYQQEASMKQLMQPLFTTSVASSLVGVSSQTLRKWEAAGLVAPVRNERTRRRLYSWAEIERMQQIRYLVSRRRVPLRKVKPMLRALAGRRVSGLITDDRRRRAPLSVPIALPR
jgi:DNA-binding transcriptional MerR regulator